MQRAYGGEVEVRLEDGSRVDLLTKTYAVEVEHSENWKEAIGQALHYTMLTDRKAGIILVSEHRRSLKHFERLWAVIAKYRLPIEVLNYP